MKIRIAIFMLLLPWIVWGQNLVPNPGFDELMWCPDAQSQISAAYEWKSAGNGTPDLYNECSEADRYMVPYAGPHMNSFQFARSGGGYAGIYVYSTANYWPREYLLSKLAPPLDQDKVYYIEFYVSPDIGPASSWCYSDAIGLAFSEEDNFDDYLPWQVLPLEPAIEHRGTVITDTAGWTRISGCYRASGGERFAIIGNFRSTEETQVIVEDPTVFPHFNYMYVEDVLVTHFNPLPDTMWLCHGEGVDLNATFLDGTYVWSTGAEEAVIRVDQPGAYSVEVHMENCVLRDTVRVVRGYDAGGFPADTVMCAGETHVLSAPVPGDYLWSTGEHQQAIVIQADGGYGLTVTNACGEHVFGTRVDFEDCDCRFAVPNVITPNQDGINDEMEASWLCDYPMSLVSFAIWDRWGNAVLELPRPDEIRWDGTYPDGTGAPGGVYAWRLVYAIVRDGAERIQVLTGDITVL